MRHALLSNVSLPRCVVKHQKLYVTLPCSGKRVLFSLWTLADLLSIAFSYDFTTKQAFVDRTKSGNSSFDASFASIYHAPLAARNGQISLRILLDWSSVEVFGGLGESTITAQIFPSDAGTGVKLFSADTTTKNVRISAKTVASSWH